MQVHLKLIVDFLEHKQLLMAYSQHRRGRDLSWAMAELMLTDNAPEWKYHACPFNRISARDLKKKYCNLVGYGYEWKCQSYESVNTFLFSILL